VVLPAHNEAHSLAACVHRLHQHLSSSDVRFTWRITIADSASTDATLFVAQTLAAELDSVCVVGQAVKGRGRALRAAWSQSDAAVLCYMDVDLSTDLRALLPLVAPLVSGHSDLAIARVVRGAQREIISRVYNRLLHLTLRTTFSDAQCGFKAGRAEIIGPLLDRVRNEWFL